MIGYAVFEISLEMSCHLSQWTILLMLGKLQAPAIFIGSWLTVWRYFKQVEMVLSIIYIIVNTGSGKGLLPDHTKLLPKPMLIHLQ